jgi:phage gpG-like protein
MPWDTTAACDADERLVAGIADMSPAMKRVKDQMLDAVRSHFEGESDGSSPWVPLAAATVEDRRRKGFGPGPILHRTGDLAGSFTGDHDAASAEIGTDRPHAVLHEEGKGVPRRPFLEMSARDIDAIDALLVAYLREIES